MCLIYSIDIRLPNAGRILIQLLGKPIEIFKNPLKILPLSNYHKLLKFLGGKSRKIICKSIVNSLINHESKISKKVQIGQLMELLKDDSKIFDTLDYVDSLERIASVVHLLYNNDPLIQFDVILFNVLVDCLLF